MPRKNQHFVTKGYLKGFTIEGEESDKYIWRYKKSPEDIPQKKSIKVVASKDYYYAQEDEHGNMVPDKLEIAIGDIENISLPIIHKIPKGKSNSFSLTADELGYFSFFIGLSYSRVPSFREPAKENLKNQVEVLTNQVYSSGMLPEPPPELKEYLDGGGKLETTIKDWADLQAVGDLSFILSQAILKKEWIFYSPYKGMSFITSDNPVVIIPPYNEKGRPDHPLAIVLFPLRRDVALVCFNPSDWSNLISPEGELLNRQFKIGSFNKKQTKLFNESVVRAAREEVYAGYFSNPLKKLVHSFGK